MEYRDAPVSSQPYYNILSLDGGGMRGLIPALFVDYLEQQAYAYSLDKGYIVENDA